GPSSPRPPRRTRRGELQRSRADYARLATPALQRARRGTVGRAGGGCSRRGAAVRLPTAWRPLAVLERHLSGLRRRAARRRAAAPPAGTRARRRGPGTRGASRWALAARTA